MSRIFIIYFTLTAALILNLALDVEKGISLRGYWCDRILFWFWLIYTIHLLINYWSKKGVKIYGWCLAILLVLSMVPLMLPFIGIVSTGFGFDRSYGKELPNNLRVQTTIKGPLGRLNLEVLRLNGIYENLLGEMSARELENDNYNVEELIGLKILEEKDDRVLAEFYFAKGRRKYWLDKK